MAGRKRARTDPEVIKSQHHAPNESIRHAQEQAAQQTEIESDGSERKPRSRSSSPDSSRSNESLVEGGENEVRGEPAEGYWSEAPGKQGGGKR